MSINCFSQGTFKGSFTFVLPSQDGIAVVSDTRLSYDYPGTEKGLGYFDPTQKVFIIHDFVLSFTGAGMVNTTFVKFFIDAYKKEKYTPKRSLDKTFQHFKEYIERKFPAEAPVIFSNVIYLAKYFDGIPYSGIYFNGRFQSGPYAVLSSSDQVLKTGLVNPENTCEQNIFYAKKLISDYAIKNNQQHLIGGPFLIAKIFPDNKIIWMENKPISSPSTLSQFADNYFKGFYQSHFFSAESKLVFEDIMHRFKSK
ncbi:20S proteasome, alpha and beta subunits [Cnuella takakiae]|uniref:20S proteasome, alpha and beta subunits n=1 Tax=Cnuella takakiae TaxID=1302690 RepID=A0A1M5G0G7_9BACT|nr:hypothetical protein [Cnuella takakiae]OLY92281.1 hypothetical protein BUE76_10545 [Cnuella takakiae]SHF97144.1 20S proteasome, alpha and beta subunits [Cnuella takakiae]